MKEFWQSRPTHLLSFLVVFLLSALPQGTAHGQSLKNIDLVIQEDWPVQAGQFYCIKFSIVDTAANLSTNDRKFYFVVAPQERDCKVTQEVILPAGGRQVEGEVYVPVNNLWVSYRCHLETDGNFTKDRQELLSTRIDLQQMQGVQRGVLVVNNAVKATQSLVISERRGRRIEKKKPYSIPEQGVPNLMSIGRVVDNSGAFYNYGSNWMNASNEGLQAIQSRYLPKSWIGLSSIDFIVIPETDLEDVFKKQTEEFEAIRKWVAVGGCLVVHSCEPSFLNAEKFRRRMVGPSTQFPSWKLRSISTGLPGSVSPPQAEFSFVAGDAEDSKLSERQVKELKDGNLAASFGMGSGNLVFTSNNLESNRFPWMRLTSMANRGDASFHSGEKVQNEFGIPGVGKPPVISFIVLIGIFVLLIGPVTYVTLRRQKRIPLMFFVVPALSLLACFGIVFFSLIQEGIFTKGRIVSVTDIDPDTGASVTRSVQTYYSAFQPSPYDFPGDTMVRVATTNRDWVYEQNETTAVSGGLVRSRTAHQFEVVQVDRCFKGVSLEQQDDKRFIKNNLGTEIQFLLVNVNGVDVFFENIPADGKVAFEDGVQNDAPGKFRKMARDNSPQVSFAAFQSSYGYYRTMGRDTGNSGYWRKPTAISDYFSGSTGELAGLRQFVAVVKDWKEFEISQPKSNVQYRGNLHIVRGAIR